MSTLKEKVIIITGAAQGLGLAAAKVVASQGAKLSLIDYNAETLAQAKADIEKENPGIEILTVVTDVSKESAVKNYVDETVKKFGRIDGFYNNAGIEGPHKPMAEYDSKDFDRVTDINLKGVFYGLKYVLAVMKEQKYGHIVNVASVGGIRGVMDITPYVASKHGVAGMSKSAALEYGRYGINTNAIAPGAILTPMVADAFKKVNPENPQAAEDQYAQYNPTKRLGRPEEVGKVVAFLLSDDASYISGQVIAIDGGQSNAYGNV